MESPPPTPRSFSSVTIHYSVGRKTADAASCTALCNAKEEDHDIQYTSTSLKRLGKDEHCKDHSITHHNGWQNIQAPQLARWAALKGWVPGPRRTQASTHLTMMVGTLLSHRTSQLGHLDLFLGQVALDAGEHDLALTRFQAVHEAGNGAHVVHVAEEDQLAVDELVVRDVPGVLGVQVQLPRKGKHTLHCNVSK